MAARARVAAAHAESRRQGSTLRMGLPMLVLFVIFFSGVTFYQHHKLTDIHPANPRSLRGGGTRSVDGSMPPVSEEGGGSPGGAPTSGGFTSSGDFTQLAVQAVSETAGFVKSTVNAFQGAATSASTGAFEPPPPADAGASQFKNAVAWSPRLHKSSNANQTATFVPRPPVSTRDLPDATVRGGAGWKEMLAQVADEHGVVLFATATANYVDIMNTFYLTAVAPHRIHNFMFVAMNGGMCKTPAGEGSLHPGAFCFEYPHDIKGGGNWWTAEFAKVVQVKTDVLMGIVQEGYTAFLSDADIHFLRNPLPELLNLDPRADMLIQNDMDGGLNSGFMYIRPTEWGLNYIGEVLALQKRIPKIRQQEAVNAVLKTLKSTALSFHSLSITQFPCGIIFYQKAARRMFAWHEPCPTCLVVHNNYILGDVAKEYRAKEFLQWAVDTAGGADTVTGYYTSPSAKYLMVGNPDPHVMLTTEEDMLKNAFKLGKLLGRIVILPGLRCRKWCQEGGCQPRAEKGDIDVCAMNARYFLYRWNAALGKHSWREMMFRYNPLTHPDVRLKSNLHAWTYWADNDPRVAPGFRNPSLPETGLQAMEHAPEQAHYIQVDKLEPKVHGNLFGDEAPQNKVVTHTTATPGVLTPGEAREMFGKIEDRVLRFHSLYHVNVKWDSWTGSDYGFDQVFRKAIVKADLRQVEMPTTEQAWSANQGRGVRHEVDHSVYSKSHHKGGFFSSLS